MKRKMIAIISAVLLIGAVVAYAATQNFVGSINGITVSGTAGSTLAVGTGGTLGTGAYATIANYLIGDGNASKIRSSRLVIANGSGAATITITMTSNYNGDTSATTADIAKGATVGIFTLSADGTNINLNVTGECIGIISSDVVWNGSTSPANTNASDTGSNMGITVYYDNGGGGVDLSGAVDTGTGVIYIDVVYVTSE